jgi:mRNA interferase MazF
VPFPFVETPRLRERPALVIGVLNPSPAHPLLWVLMITSAANKGWLGDVSLEERFAECGLDVPCVVRTTKVSTVEASKARKSGSLPSDLLNMVNTEVHRSLF